MGHGSVSPQKIVIIPFTRKRGVRVVKEPAVSGHTLQLTTEEIPWTYSESGFDKEGTAEICDEQGIQVSLNL
jgi:hypothetical protein